MNTVTLYGRLGADPETKELGADNSVTNFSMATSRKYFSKKEDKQVEDTQWHKCSAFGKTGLNIAKYLQKGSPILLQGRIEYRSYEKDGVKMWATNILVDRFEFVGQSKDSQDAKDAQTVTSAGALSQPEPKFNAAEEIPF
jgi:single-strand DNA-binding protein